jgi:hypothetical protein
MQDALLAGGAGILIQLLYAFGGGQHHMVVLKLETQNLGMAHLGLKLMI